MPDGKSAKKPASNAATASAGSRAGSAPATAAVAAKGKQAPAKTKPSDGAAMRQRLDVRKTYKLFIGGAFPRSESGRSYPVYGHGGELLAHAARASRKDVREAVVAARRAFGGWSSATAYNRGQVLYRVAEMLEGRTEQFATIVADAEGLANGRPESTVAAAIDRWVWYAGWSDKVAQVAGAANPVAGPYFNFSVPEPTGVVVVIAPAESSLLGLVSVLAPVIVTGNTAVVLASEDRPLPSIALAEVLATSDIPPGVVNVLTGRGAELSGVAASHMDVNAIDLTGVAHADRPALERSAADNVKRVFYDDEDWVAQPGTRRLLAFLEVKTVWHPAGI